MEKRKTKITESLSGITDSEITPEGEIYYAKACNDLHALAPTEVLDALHIYQESRKKNSSQTQEERQKALNKLFYAIRKDLKITPKDIENQLEIKLWTSGKSVKK